jgi:hypothetical protein
MARYDDMASPTDAGNPVVRPCQLHHAKGHNCFKRPDFGDIVSVHGTARPWPGEVART